MIKTESLGLPIYDTPEIDTFDLQDFNDANQSLEGAYNEIIEFKTNIPLVNASAEVLEARKGKPTLKEKIDEIDNKTVSIDAQLAETTQQLNSRIDDIIVTPAEGITEQEIIDARQGEATLGTKISSIVTQLGKHDTEGIIITVKKDGSGDFTNISDAVASITQSSSHKKYTIYVYEGVYDVFSTLTPEELATGGVTLPDFVNLKGIGAKENIVLKGELPDTTTLDESARLSTLNLRCNNNLYNLTVTAKNCRYAVHSDNGNNIKNYTQRVENCDFIHFNNAPGLWVTLIAWGEGSSSGAKIYFKNCKFVGNAGYNTHNNWNFDEPDYHEFENCIFIGSVYSSAYAVGFTTLNSGKISKVLMKGCKFNGAIRQDQSNPDNITGLEYDISGYGNEFAPYVISSKQNIQKVMYFSEEIQEKGNHNSVAITRGTPLRFVSPERVGTMWSGDTTAHFAGLCAKDCLSTDKYVMVRTAGYFPMAYTPLSGLSAGTLIGIVNRTVSVVTNRGDAFAVVVNSDWIKFL